MHVSLLEKVRQHQPRAFMQGNGGLFCRLRELPPDLSNEVRAYNERVCPRRAGRVAHHASVAGNTAARPKSPQLLAREGLYQACLERGGPAFVEADVLAAEIGVEAATDLIRRHGAEAPMEALAARAWRSWGKVPEA